MNPSFLRNVLMQRSPLRVVAGTTALAMSFSLVYRPRNKS